MQGWMSPMRFAKVRPLAVLPTRLVAIPAIAVAAVSIGLLLRPAPFDPSRAALIAAAVGAPLLVALIAGLRSRLLADEVARLHAVNDEAEQEMASIAHDLKGPLSTVSSYLDLIAEGALGPVTADTRQAVHRAAEASARARTLVESALLLHVQAVAARPLDIETVDLRSLICEVTEALRGEITASHAEVTVERLPAVQGNAALLFRVFENLVQNAVKYARPGEAPMVMISGTCRADGRVEILVRDHGIGIPAEDHERVFEVAARAANGDAVMGHGLGLATVRRLLREQGGDAWIDAAAGDGAAVRLTLPHAA
ncbi:MAG: HAMP domain-containing sensor histidine kinase [Chloroflexi bacterium]|nr:HAMP domain-containing sensor histidine kinase [Chloroflexota bacterium]